MQSPQSAEIQPLDYDPNDFISSSDSFISLSNQPLRPQPVTNTTEAATPTCPPMKECCTLTITDIEAIRAKKGSYPRIALNSWSHITRHHYFSPSSAAKHNASYLDMNNFATTPMFRNLQSMIDANPEIPVAWMGCGRDSRTKQNKLSDSVFTAEYTFLENAHFSDLVELAQKMHPSHRNYCTMVLPSKPVHVYFDFDAGADPQHPHKHALYLHVQGHEADVQQELRQKFVAYFQQVFGREPNLSGMHWETASCINKFSLHTHITTEAFLTIDHLKVFMSGFSKYIVQQPGESFLHVQHANQHNDMEIVSLMDAGVYTKHRCFRLVECCKPGKQHLKWLADAALPVSVHEQAAPSTAELLFRGLISHAIDVSSGNYLSMDDVSCGIKSTKPKKKQLKRESNSLEAMVSADNPQEQSKSVELSQRARSIVQSILRSEQVFGDQAELNKCDFKTYGDQWCIVGDCVQGTAWCPIRTKYATSAGDHVKPQAHRNAPTVFSITSRRAKLWDWKCGVNSTRLVLLLPSQRKAILTVWKESSSSKERSSPVDLNIDCGLTSDLESDATTDSDTDTDSETELGSKNESQSEGDSPSRSGTESEVHLEGSVRPTRPPNSEAYEEEPHSLNVSNAVDPVRCADGSIETTPRSGGGIRVRKMSLERSNRAKPDDKNGLPNLEGQTKKRKVSQVYQEFDEMNLHHIDRYSIRDTRPERETIQAIIANWEQTNKRRLKKLRSKYSNRDNKATLQEKTNLLKESLFAEIVAYLNLYFKQSIRMGEPVVIVSLIHEFSNGTREWQHDMMNPKAFESSYSFLNAKVNGVECKIAKKWLEHPDSARFDKLKFQPLPDGEVEKRQRFNDYNLWKGFKISLADGERYLQKFGRDECVRQIRPFLEHIMQVWCRGETELYEYTINWMA